VGVIFPEIDAGTGHPSTTPRNGYRPSRQGQNTFKGWIDSGLAERVRRGIRWSGYRVSRDL